MFRYSGIVKTIQNCSRYSIVVRNQTPQNFHQGIRNLSHFNRVTPVILIDNRQKYSFRFASTESTLTEKIPEPPAIPQAPSAPIQDVLEKGVETTQAVVSGAEPAFSTLGLGGWSPVGIVQNCMEYVHVTLDVPWWGAILIGTICVRTLLFPLVIMAQRNGAKLANNMPQLQHLQAKLTEARQMGNQIEAARYSQAMMEFMRDKQVNPLKNMIVPLAQAPLFISFFIGLRQMANAPVESMKEGGLWWFTDLTVADPYYLLPIITSITMLATIEIGTDSARMQHQNMQTMKYVLRAMPVVIFPFTMNFPGAIVQYWTCTNIISLIQVSFLRIPAVREFFKIDKIVTQPQAAKQPKKGFVKGLKESWTNMKITRELEERRRVDEIMFQRAAKGAVQKTYKHDPTKVAVEAKKR